MPRSPLPTRHGLQAAWVRTPDGGVALPWAGMGEWLRERLGERVDVGRLLAEGRFVRDDLGVVREDDPVRAATTVWFHRDLREEPEVPGELVVVHRDERIVVVDKPAFLSTIPRGNHVVQSVVVRMRERLGLPELSSLHRLDRITSGLVVLATEKRWRAPYQRLWETGEVAKTYRALAPVRDDLDLPVTVRDHIRKVPGHPPEVVPGAPVNAETRVELEERYDALARYRLVPRTGRTHQLRLHLLGLGIPIVGDPLYPVATVVDVDDFATPLQLLAAELSFTDPVDGSPRHFASARVLPLGPG